jgi:DNA excision repair protein ERCC-6
MDYSTEEYEKSFIEKYLEKRAGVRIKELEDRIEGCDDDTEVERLRHKIGEIREGLIKDKRLLQEPEEERKSAEVRDVLDFCWDADADDSDHAVFVRRCMRAKAVYCDSVGAEPNGFEDALLAHSEWVEGMRIPAFLWNYLFPYQQDGVRWLLGLFRSSKGGILADDMGLGKTLQVIAFLAALFLSGSIEKALILCPATVTTQWLAEWKRFYPFVRIFVSSEALGNDGVYLTTYEKFKATASRGTWDVLVLDEGHRIKNKEAKVTVAAKTCRAEHRFVLTGTPIQNNLTELWSLFDFINPGLLGSYTSFYEEFEDAISRGGYKHASNEQVEDAYRQSVILRSLIDPYIMRRSKTQVSHRLPPKTDKIIFCSLTDTQIQLYTRILDSSHIERVLLGKANLLSGISLLRKVCNHPRLFLSSPRVDSDARLASNQEEADSCSREAQDLVFRSGRRSGEKYDLVESSCKIKIMLEYLKRWKKEGHKVLLFSQTVQMLNIIEECVREYEYLRMDGTTPVGLRARLVARFSDEDVFVFLLTTRVGGLGLNLTAASRIIIYDPDWNPSTDTQAKERAWRYGQKRDVEIYRLVCRDTIEEKIYQKQIFKDLLSKKVLKNPRLSRFFNKACLGELFTFTHSLGALEVKVHEEHREDGDLREIMDKDISAYERMKMLSEKPMLTGGELLEYIRLRERGA